jgi:hypothetical protein
MKRVLLTWLLLSCVTAFAQTSGLAAPPAYAVATGSVNVLAVTQPGATLRAGQAVVFLPNLANTTTTPTLNVNGLGAVTITKNGTAALAAGDLTTTAVAMVFYDGTEFQLLNPQTTNTTGGLTGVTAWAAGTGTLPTQPSNSAGFMGPVTGGTAYAIQLPATMTAGFARMATPATVNGWNTSQLTSALINVNDLTGLYITGGGTAQAQTATLSPAATALSTGLHVYWKPAAANSAAAPTLAVNGLTATAITKCGTTALVANDLTTTAVAHVIYDGTQYQLLNPQAAGCGASSGGLPTGTTGQTVYYAAGGTTGTATSSITTNGAATGSQIGFNGQYAQIWTGPASIPTTTASCAAAATSCTLSSTTGFPTTGGYIFVNNGGSFEANIMQYTGVSGLTLTGLTRGLFGTSDGTMSSGDKVALVTALAAPSTSSFPSWITFANGATIANADSSTLNGFYANQLIFYSGGNGISSAVYGFKGINTTIQVVNGSPTIQNGSGVNNWTVDSNGVSAVTEATLAVVAGTTTITPVSGVVGLTGTAPTAMATMTPSTSCTTSGTACDEVILGVGMTTTTGGNFFAAYTMAANSRWTCTYLQIAAPTANRWYCK